MNTPPIRRIHLLGFVEQVRHIHANMPDRRFCFVLGAGASKTSLIPTAGELGLEWLKKIHTERGGAAGDFAKWLSEGTHGIKGLPPKTSTTDLAAFAAAYPAIYHAKWGHDPAQGHAEIEHYIEAAKPSYGYYALAEILASDDPTNDQAIERFAHDSVFRVFDDCGQPDGFCLRLLKLRVMAGHDRAGILICLAGIRSFGRARTLGE